jgi:transposase
MGKDGRSAVSLSQLPRYLQRAASEALGGHYTPIERASKIIELLNEGMSVRAVSCVMDVTQGTILALLRTAAKHASHRQDQIVRGVRPRFVQCDELWTFVHTKQGHLHWDGPREWAMRISGWQWTVNRN